ncbi:MAG TPA: amino acid adenylation domain-containing protein, partial [Pyrinomonadaceae bacterium]
MSNSLTSDPSAAAGHPGESPADDVYVFPATHAQQRFWFLSQFESGSAFYNIPAAIRLHGRLDTAALGESINEIVRRHESLRTIFVEVDGLPVQCVFPSQQQLVLPLFDLTGMDAAEQDAEVSRLIDEEIGQPFKLSQWPLLRVKLLRLDQEHHIVVLTMHHIISDGWSLGVFARELAALYESYATGTQAHLPELSLQYADYAVWQKEWMSGEVLAGQLDYWRKQLGGNIAQLELPTDRPRPPVQSFSGATHTFRLPAELSAALENLSRARGVTLFMTLLAALDVLFYRYTGQRDIWIGSPVANRNRVEVEGMIGLFVNTLVLRTDLSGNPTFLELLERVREVSLGAYAHQDLPFEKLVEELQPERDLSRAPLFQVMFVLQNASPPEAELPGLTLSFIEVDTKTAKFDLSISMSENAGGLNGSIRYNTDLFDAATIERLARHFEAILKAAAADSSQRIDRLPLLTQPEREHLLAQPGRRRQEFPPASSLHQLFEAQAARTPDAVALIFEDRQLTYRQLNERSNQLAHYLQRQGVKAETLVGLLCERSLEMIVGLLGTLKAGGAYVPLDPAYPQQRLSFMLNDAGVRVLLTQSHLRDSLPAHDAEVISLDVDWAQIARESSDDAASGVSPENLAYVIYTSGSTGNPKGVLVQHASVCNLAFALDQRIYAELPRPLRVGVNAPLSFDASVKQLVRLLFGDALCLIPDDVRLDSRRLLDYLRRHQVNVCDSTPTQLSALLEAGLLADGAPAPLAMLVGGEAIEDRLWARLARARTTKFWNVYGPTECTVDATVCPIETAAVRANIGQAIANAEVYVLNGMGEPVPVGVAAELYIGGAGVARGYLNRPDLTAASFVPHPYGRRAGERLYRTGDLVRFGSQGELEYLGRADEQVKIRGHRIELREIEAALGRLAGVREAVTTALANERGEKRLVAYVVANAEPAPTASELRRALKESLPEYMIPSYFVMLEELPLSPNGKVDRRRLPQPTGARPASAQAFIEPRDELEEALAGLWRDVLGLESVGVRDNFFELGGHSLLATQILSRVRSRFGLELSLRDFFVNPTLEGMAEIVGAAPGIRQPLRLKPLDAASRDGGVMLSFAQQRLWFLEHLHPGSPLYHMPSAVYLKGELDTNALGQSLNEVIRRHEILRTTFRLVQGQPLQFIAPHLDLDLPVKDLEHLPQTERMAEARRLATEENWRTFDLTEGPLVRATLLRLSLTEHVLLLTMHHIISDGWSVGILIRELAALYESYATGTQAHLPELSLQYADYAVWQREWLNGEVLAGQLDYWRKQLGGTPAVLEMPADKRRPSVQTFRGATERLELPTTLLAALNQLSRREGVTLFTLLLAAFQVLLHRYTGEEEIVVGTPIAGRNRTEIENLIGLFVNTLVLRTDLSGNPTFLELLGRVNEVVLGAYAHQDLPFEKLVEELQPERDLSRAPLFQVMFVLQNTPMPRLELSGLAVELMRTDNRTAKFDFILNMEERGELLAASVEYSTDLFEAATIRRMLEHFQRLLESVAAAPREHIKQLPMLGQAECEQLLYDGNHISDDAPPAQLLHELFEAQAARTPDAIALIFEDQQLTYRQLNERSNQLAHYLQRQGVSAETLVALLCERSPEMIVALLATLKAGGAYVPLDPAYPQERISFILSDSRASVLLTQKSLGQALPQHPSHVLYLDSDWESISLESTDKPLSPVRPENAAYVIYTSGSTGTPKGVLIQHSHVSRLLDSTHHWFDFSSQDTWTLFHSIAFDFSVWELWGALAYGARLVIVPYFVSRTPSAFYQLLIDERVTVLNQTPSAFRQLMQAEAAAHVAGQAAADDSCALALRVVIFGGEALELQSLQPWIERHGDARPELINMYGITETTVHVTYRRITSLDLQQGAGSVIGERIPDLQLYLLDEELQPVPLGVAAELYVGGAGVARGYLGRAELTAERFIPHPYGKRGERLYRTGDVGRRLSNGEVEYVGRRDEQVK